MLSHYVNTGKHRGGRVSKKFSRMLENKRLLYSGAVPKALELLQEVKAKEVHYKGDCPETCTQMLMCEKIRFSKQVVKSVMKEVSKRFPIFEDPDIDVVGSMKEKTKDMSKPYSLQLISK